MQSRSLQIYSSYYMYIIGMEMRLTILNILLLTWITTTYCLHSCGVIGVIECYEPNTIDIHCWLIQPSDSVLEAELQACAKGNFVSLYLFIYQRFITYTVNLTLLPDNIQRLSIQGNNASNSKDYHLRLVTDKTHLSILNIEIYSLNVDNTLEDSRVFQQFPKLILLRFSDIRFRHNPVLQGLASLEELYFIGYSHICDIDQVISVNHSLVGGLVKLNTFVWQLGCIEFIMPESFRDLSELTKLSLADNLIDYNKTRVLDGSAFRGLTKLHTLILQNNFIDTLSSGIFRGLFNLVYVYIRDNLLNCSCALQWVSIVHDFGVHFLGTCASNGSAVAVEDSSLYTQCFSELSYQCFNRDNKCTEECLDTATGYVCGCGEGYGLILHRESQYCLDVDECLYSQNNCEQECNNTIGSFNCYCNEGYQLTSNGTSCVDIDECNSNITRYCQQQCTNIIGTYSCSCDAGYALNTDLRTCIDVNECARDNTCTSLCINTPGSYLCRCEVGFYSNYTNCTDIDECQSANGGCQLLCINTEGSYVCGCGVGYQLDSRNVSRCVASSTYKLLGTETNETVVLCLLLIAIFALIVSGVIIVLLCVVIFCCGREKVLTDAQALNIANKSCITQSVGERQRAMSNPLYESINGEYMKFRSCVGREEDPVYTSLPPTARVPVMDNEPAACDKLTYSTGTNLVFTSPGFTGEPVFVYQESTI